MKKRNVMLLLLIIIAPITGILCLVPFNIAEPEMVDAVVIFDYNFDAFHPRYSDHLGFSYRREYHAINGFSASMTRETFE